MVFKLRKTFLFLFFFVYLNIFWRMFLLMPLHNFVIFLFNIICSLEYGNGIYQIS